MGGSELVAGVVILTSVALLLPRGCAPGEAIPESLPAYIQAKDAQLVAFPRRCRSSPTCAARR